MAPEYAARTRYTDGRSYDRHRETSFRHRLIGRKEQAALAEFLSEVPEGGLVLDVACGTGKGLRVILDRNRRGIGLDISEAMLARAREKLAGEGMLAGLLCGEAEHLPFADRTFDAVCAFRLLRHLPDPVRARVLSELARVSRGPVIVDAHHSLSLEHTFNRFLSLFRGRKRRKHRRKALSTEGLRAELAAAGLELREMRFVARFWLDECILLAQKS